MALFYHKILFLAMRDKTVNKLKIQSINSSLQLVHSVHILVTNFEFCFKIKPS